MFWDPEIFVLNSESKPYFDLLSKVGIFHQSPESCAKFIDSIWDNVLGWWRSEEVEESRKIFVNRYANVGDEPITQLKKIFLDW
jgi:putative transferase (TIGR04331 family)